MKFAPNTIERYKARRSPLVKWLVIFLALCFVSGIVRGLI